MAHVDLFIVIAALAIAVYLGLAIYVITRNPRQPIVWVFGAFCLTVASYYLCSLFLFPGPEALSSGMPFSLRWKSAAISFIPTLYLHLASFYFPPTWRQVRRWALPLFYLASAWFSLAALFTYLLVAGSRDHPLPHIAGQASGPLMGLLAVFFGLALIVSSAGLVAGYRVASSPSLHHQILCLLMPTGLVIFSGLVNWIIVLTQGTSQVPHEFDDLLLIIVGFLYTGAVLRYGYFVGRPTARRDLFYSALKAAMGLTALYLTLSLGRWLMAHTLLPYSLATAIPVVVAAISFPVASRWVTAKLDGLLFQTEHQQQMMIHHLADTLAETPSLEELQTELLGALCAAVDVCGGYIALSRPDSPSGTVIVRVVQGNLSVKRGDQVRRPPLSSRGPQLVTALLPHQQTEPDWRDVALFHPLTATPGSRGILAMGEKRDGKSFNSQEVDLCAELVGRLDAASRVSHLRERRNHYLEAARLHDQALRRLEQQLIAPPHPTLAMWERHTSPATAAPLEIRLLGPLQVIRNGQVVSEAAWGTERAKAMLAYLLWRGPAGETREEISTALWPGRPPEETANVFHVTLHRLRRALEPERARGSRYILYQRGRYHFNPETPHWLDVTTFQVLIGEGKPASLREAVALYRGPYLEDVIWALPAEAECERRIMEQLYADALRRLAVQARGQEAMPYLEMLLAVEPSDEATHNTLVTSYLARGRRDLAQRQVTHWRKTLAEVDLEPSPEARALWLKVENRNQ